MHNERGKENADFDAPLLVSNERDQRMNQEVHKYLHEDKEKVEKIGS